MPALTNSVAVAPRRNRLAWCLFDFANSAFPTVAITAFGAPYFVGVLVGEQGMELGPFHVGAGAAWGLAVSLSMLLVTVSSPVMGALADRAQSKRAFLALYVALCVTATAGLGFVPPGAAGWAFLLYVLANFAFEGSYVFYNAFLPELTTPDRFGRLSGYGWALGYVGGLLALVASLAWLPESYTAADAGEASWIFFIVAAWFLVFSLPMLVWVRDADKPQPTAPAQSGTIVKQAFRSLARTIRNARAYRAVVIFLVAFFLYNDAVVTVIEFTGVFTSEVLAFSPKENIFLFLILNVIAAPGALFFGRLLDKRGGVRTIRWTLLVWVLVVIGVVSVQTKMMFWPVAALAATVIGATQAASRALMARFSPQHRVGEFMGLLALSGKGSAVVGPLMYGFIADAAGSIWTSELGHRIAIAAVGCLFVLAYFTLGRIDEEQGVAQAKLETSPA